MVTKQRIENFQLNPFLNGPTEFLVSSVAKAIEQVPQFKLIFGEAIDNYEREDYSYRELPALRVYNLRFTKEHESHYIIGELMADVIFPPNIRRQEHQFYQDTISAALLQQFRRPTFFADMKLLVPGLNELGKVFSADKTLAMKLGDDVAPLTQLTINFRIDQKIWDDYLESHGRTKDEPFKVTLADLEEIVSEIQALRSNNAKDIELTIQGDQTIGDG